MKNKTYIKIIAIMLIFLLTCIPIPVYAARIQTEKGAVTNNKLANNYTKWSKSIYSYLYKENDEFIRVEYDKSSKNIYIETYSDTYQLQEQQVIKNTADYFGGFFAGATANYFIFGNSNPKESSIVNVFEIVKYSKDFKKLKSLSIKDCNTTTPFDAGSLRCAEYGAMLYIRTSHKMYKTADGLNHQANVQIAINTDTMEETFCAADISSGDGYVSHSFNQFIVLDENDLIAADHGDGYPRAFVLNRYKEQAGSQTVSSRENVKVTKFKGHIGNNTTNASAGGLEVSDSSYLLAYNQVDGQADNQVFHTRNTRNVYVSITSKENFTESGTKIVTLSSYQEDRKYTAYTPQLVKINSNRFMVLWQEKPYTINYFDKFAEPQQVCYVLLDGQGNFMSKVNKVYGYLSDCKPIVIDNQVLWYYTNNNAPIFISVPADGTAKQDSLIEQEVFQSGGLYYGVLTTNEKEGTVAVIGETKTNKEKQTLNIPATVKRDGVTYQVTKINKWVFSDNKIRKAIVIGKNITSIEDYAFAFNEKLKTVTITSKKLKKVAQSAFLNYPYPNITIKVPASKMSAYKKILDQCDMKYILKK